MFSVKSEKTSLLDLTINELRNVVWNRIDDEEFVEELKDVKLLTRIKEADIEIFKVSHIPNLEYYGQEAIEFVLDSLMSVGYSKTLPSAIFDKNQFPIEFLEKYEKLLPLYYIEQQQCITPEFYDKHHEEMDTSRFWERMFGNDLDRIRKWSSYDNGKFHEKLMSSSAIRFLPAKSLSELGLDVPNYYNNVISVQRIMSYDPCSDGQRAFSVWLRKYRRVYKDETGYPTWDQLLTMYADNPRMDNGSYMSWIHQNVLKLTEDQISEYRTTLSIGETSTEQYEEVTGEDEDGNAIDLGDDDGCSCSSCVAARRASRAAAESTESLT